jgi:hypothetical protein
MPSAEVFAVGLLHERGGVAMEPLEIYVELSAAAERALADNGLSLEEIVRRAAAEATFRYEASPAGSGSGRDKDVVTIILASGVAAGLIAHGISRVLATILNRPQMTEVEEFVAVTDANGAPVRDSSGRPVTRIRRRFELLEPSREQHQQEFDWTFGGAEGLRLRFKSADERGVDPNPNPNPKDKKSLA